MYLCIYIFVVIIFHWYLDNYYISFSIMYLHVYLCNSPANPIGIGVIYVLAPNIVGNDPTHQIPKLVNE